MDKRKSVLTLLFLTVVASGCINGGTEGAIDVNSLQISPSEIHQGDSINVILDVSNNGLREGDVRIGEEGGNIMGNRCSDIFDLESFSASATGRTTVDLDSETIEPGHDIRMNWVLRNIGDVPLHGRSCELTFSVPFNYSVSAFRQVQIKESSDVEDAELEYQSSSGPMDIDIQTLPGSTGKSDVYIAEDGEQERKINFDLRFINNEPTENDPTTGIVEMDTESLELELSDPLELNEDEHCDIPERIEIFDGDSHLIRCEVPVPEESDLDGPSQISEFSVDLDYTFERDAGQRTVEVEYRG